MNIDELIEVLQEVKELEGNLDVYLLTDHGQTEESPFNVCVDYMDEDGETYHIQDLLNYYPDGEFPPEIKKVVVIES